MLVIVQELLRGKAVPAAIEAGPVSEQPLLARSAFVRIATVVEAVPVLSSGFGSLTWTVVTTTVSFAVNVWSDGFVQLTFQTTAVITGAPTATVPVVVAGLGDAVVQSVGKVRVVESLQSTGVAGPLSEILQVLVTWNIVLPGELAGAVSVHWSFLM